MSGIYLETTIPSYLAAAPSRDLITAAHQQITHEWWKTAQIRFNIYISQAVLLEISRGDPTEVTKRQSIVKNFKILELNEDVIYLVRYYNNSLGLQGKAKADIPHFAFAVSYNLDYLITWNCSHIANGEIIKKLITVNKHLKRETPIIVTPEELMD